MSDDGIIIGMTFEVLDDGRIAQIISTLDGHLLTLVLQPESAMEQAVTLAAALGCRVVPSL